MGLFSKKSSSRTSSVMSNAKGSSTSLASTSLKSPTVPSKMSFQNGSAMNTVPSIPIPPAPNPNEDPVGYLKSLHAVRERTKHVLERAKKDQLTNFNVDMSKFQDVVEYVVSIIKVYYQISHSCSCTDFYFYRETFHQNIQRFLLMVDGNTLKLEADLV